MSSSSRQPRRDPWLVLSAVVVGLVVLLAVFLVVRPKSGGHSSTSAGPAGSGPASVAASASAGSVDLGGTGWAPSDHDSSVPESAPTDVTWQIVNTVALPVSRSAGPLITNGVIGRCYAHTPRGAVMAALNLTYRVAIEAPQTTVLDQQAVPSTGEQTLRANLQTVTQSFQPGDAAQIAGFRVVSYTPDTTVIALVNGRQNASTLKESDVTVQWNGGDWKLVIQPDGSIGTQAVHINSLAGYVPFGGV